MFFLVEKRINDMLKIGAGAKVLQHGGFSQRFVSIYRVVIWRNPNFLGASMFSI